MKKKFLTVLLALVAALCLCFGLAACDDKSSDPPVTQTNPNGGSAQEYTITYDANGGAFAGGETFTQTVKENSALTAPTSPSRQYYTFAGWAKNKGGTEMWDFSNDKVTGNTTLYAKWAQKSATVLSVEGASIDEGDIFMVVPPLTSSVQLANKVVCSDDSYWQLYYDELGQTEIPTKVAANLGGGLSDGENVFYILVSSQDRTQTNTYVLTVYRQYTTHVTYRTNGAVYDTKDIVTGTPLTQSYDIACSVRGYTFNGWEHTEKFGENVWGPVTFTADLTANTYKVTFDSNGGSEVAEKTVTFGQSYSFTKLTRTGYTFLGWWAGNTQLTDEDGSVLPAWNIDNDTQVTAHWQANKYAVTLNRNDNEAGSVSGGGEHNYDSQVTIRATTNRGYTFRGWYDANDELVTEEEQYTFKMGFAVSYTAKWDYYTLTTTTRKNEIGGTLSQSYNETKVTAGTKVTLTAITNLGYIFDGWYKGEDEVSKDPNYQYTMAKENVSFEARWSLDPAMADYTFTSTSTVCTIKDVKVIGKTKYTVPDYVTNIQQGAFAKCNSIETITIPFVGGSRKTFKDTYQYPFGYIFGTSKTYGYEEVKQYYHGSSTKDTTSTTYYIPSTLKNVILTGGEILYGAFYNCSGLTSIEIPASVTSIGERAFAYCRGLTSIEIPASVTNIRDSAFSNCSGLTGVYITDLAAWCKIDFENEYANPLYYAEHLYWNDEEVKNLTIPAGIKEIKGNAFYNCSGLTSVTIGSGVTEIGIYAFNGCSGLTGVYITDLAAWCAIKFYYNDFYFGSNPLYYAQHLYMDGEEVTELKIPDGVTSIGEYAFYGCSGLTSITIPDSVTKIGEYAFKGCSGLESVTILDGVTKIGNYAFYGCSGLTSIEIPDSVASIGDWAFEDCRGLESVTIGSGVTSIGYHAFYNCNGLTSVTIGSGVKSIEGYAFYGCSGLTSITIPDGVTSIGYDAFYGCSGLMSVTIGSGVTSIGDWAFGSCSGLESVYYKGTPAKWSKISINYNYNPDLQNATRYYFSDQTPTEEQWRTSENWWHYDEDGETIILWTKEE